MFSVSEWNSTPRSLIVGCHVRGRKETFMPRSAISEASAAIATLTAMPVTKSRTPNHLPSDRFFKMPPISVAGTAIEPLSSMTDLAREARLSVSPQTPDLLAVGRLRLRVVVELVLDA